MELFGWKLTKNNEDQAKRDALAVAPKQTDDGAIIVSSMGANFVDSFIDMDGVAGGEADLVTKYRELSLQPEIDQAVDEVVNEAVSMDGEYDVCDLDTSKLTGEGKKNETLAKKINEEFKNVLLLLDFDSSAYDIFRRWYIDGRMYYQIVYDPERKAEGIQELRYIDPRKLRKIREVARQPIAQDKKGAPRAITTLVTKSEFFAYSEKGFGKIQPTSPFAELQQQVQAVKIEPEQIIHVTSGKMDAHNRLVLSYLHAAIKPLNNLRSMEDARVIYSLVRAPERRVFYIDVGILPKAKAEQYMKDTMARHRNKLTYDRSTGEIADGKRHMHMLEDYWFPRREGNRSTEVETLPAGQNLGQMEEVDYFKKALNRSLSIPLARLNSEQSFSFGRGSEITREEIKFQKLIVRLRMRFSKLIIEALKTQLILKGIIKADEAEDIASMLNVKYNNDNNYSELKSLEVMKERMSVAQDMDVLADKGYFSKEDIAKDILKFNDEQITELKARMKQVEAEAAAAATMGDGTNEQQ